MNVLDLGELTPSPAREPGDIDFINVSEVEPPGTLTLRCLSLLFLFTLRDGGDSLLLRTSGEIVQFWMSVGVRWDELVAPPLHVALKLRRLVWCLGRSRRRIDRAAVLVREFGRPGLDVPEPPWESRFLVRLGSGFKGVVAKAEAFPGCVDLTLRLADLTIDQSAAEAKLKEVCPDWRDRATSSEEAS
jgi:hypothetical protein